MTRTISTSPPPCQVAAWPEFPDIYLALDCPEGLVCITEYDRTRIITWVNQVERIHEHLVQTCPGVKWMPLPPLKEDVSP